MKLFLLTLFLAISNADSRVFKCGIISSDCVSMMVNGECPVNIFCPIGYKRQKADDEKCCCVLRSLLKSKVFVPNFDQLKTNLLEKCLMKIDEIFKKSKSDVLEKRKTNGSEAINKIISNASKVISDEMITAIKNLATLANVDFEDVLSSLFKASNDVSMMQDEDIQSILKEAAEIYNKGESAFKEFDEMFVPESDV